MNQIYCAEGGTRTPTRFEPNLVKRGKLYFESSLSRQSRDASISDYYSQLIMPGTGF